MDESSQPFFASSQLRQTPFFLESADGRDLAHGPREKRKSMKEKAEESVKNGNDQVIVYPRDVLQDISTQSVGSTTDAGGPHASRELQRTW